MFEDIISSVAVLGSIFGWAFFSFWSAIPAGIALKVSPLTVIATVTLSYGSGVLLVVVVGAPLRERIQKRSGLNSSTQAPPQAPHQAPHRALRAAQQAWQNYGLLGLSLVAPMTVGAQVGAVIGLAFGAKPYRLVVAMTLGAMLWGILIALAVVTGLMTASEIAAT